MDCNAAPAALQRLLLLAAAAAACCKAENQAAWDACRLQSRSDATVSCRSLYSLYFQSLTALFRRGKQEQQCHSCGQQQRRWPCSSLDFKSPLRRSALIEKKMVLQQAAAAATGCDNCLTRFDLVSKG
jgi:hypothetical protein